MWGGCSGVNAGKVWTVPSKKNHTVSGRGGLPVLWERRVCEGEVLPSWYGMAWFDWMTRQIVAYPVPLHWVMGWVRIVTWHIKFPPWRHHTTLRDRERLKAEGLL